MFAVKTESDPTRWSRGVSLDQVSKDHAIGWDGHVNAGLRIKYVSELMDTISTCQKNATAMLSEIY